MTRRRLELAVATALLIAALLPRITTLAQPLLEKHPWRQTWTAWGALAMSQDGVDLLHAPLPIFGPPWSFPQEFPLTQAVGSLLIDLGLGADLAMRLLSLGVFFLCSYLLYRIVDAWAGRTAAIAAWFVFAFSPYGVVWSRASLVEYPALAGALGYAWFGVGWRREGGWRLLAMALACGTIGMLIKPTGALFCTMPIALAAVPSDAQGLRGWFRSRLDPRFLALCLVPFAIGAAWTEYVDLWLKQYPAMAFLAPSAVRDYYIDPLENRFRFDVWRDQLTIWSYAAGIALVPATLLGIWAALRSRERWLWAGVLLALALPVLVFLGGFRRHDYYTVQISWVIAAFTGIGLAWLWSRVRLGRRVPIMAVVALCAWLSWSGSADYWSPIYQGSYDAERVLPVAREIEAATRPGELVVMVGRGHDTDALYYSHRRGMLLSLVFPGTPGNLTAAVLGDLPKTPYVVLASWVPILDRIDVQGAWPWSGVLGAHTYALGRRPTELRGSPFVGTDDRAAADAAVRGTPSLMNGTLELPCDGASHPVPAGTNGTWLFVQAPPGAKIDASALYAPMPGRRVLVLSPSLTFGQPSVSLFCYGAPSIVIEAAYDAAPPG